MHPAYSVILFTTLSGAGYGLLIWLSVFAALSLVETGRGLGLAGFGLAFSMVTAGLLASTFHLGRPERAWRAFSQWSTSWLSREGIVAVATFLPSGLLAFWWWHHETTVGVGIVLAIATILGAGLTVYCTGMIYASLPTIRQWHHPLVPWVFVALALATGAVLMNLLTVMFTEGSGASAWIAFGCLILAGFLKLLYWNAIARTPARHTAESATGLGKTGRVRPLEPAHTQPNFVMREMSYDLGRRYKTLLRQIAIAFGFLMPIGLHLVDLLLGGLIGAAALWLAAMSVGFGIGVERWLFFAEAQHVVTLYYGRATA